MIRFLGKILKVLQVYRSEQKTLIPQLEYLMYIERLRILKLPTLAQRRSRRNMLQTFKTNGTENIPSDRVYDGC